MTGKHACFLSRRGIKETTNSADFTARTTATKRPVHLRAAPRESAFSTKRKLVRQAIISCLVSSAILLMFASYGANAEVVASASSLQFESPVNIAWHNCGKNLECVQVPVPLDWNSPAGPQISLSVARHLASKPNQRTGSLFVNYGGPGVAGVPIVKAAGEGLDSLGDGRLDIVGWDPRGTAKAPT